MALLRLPAWTVAFSPRKQTCQNLQFSYGVFPVQEPEDPENWNRYAKSRVGERKLPGKLALLAAGPSPKHAGANHRLEIIEL